MSVLSETLIRRWRSLAWLFAAALAAVSMEGPVRAQPDVDPPGRVGRVADVSGPVWWFDLQEGRWTEAQRNRPVTAGDRLSTGRDARAELRIGSTTLKMAEGTELEMLRLDDERVRIQLHRGSIALRLRSSDVAGETQLGTDEAWLQPMRGGLYRLDRDDDTTYAASWRGELRVTDEAGLEVDGGRRLQLWREGPARQLRHRWATVLDDAFAARVLREDRDDERSASAAYVSPEMTGFEELDRNGRWDQHPDYGPVWTPLTVRGDWAPYRQGQWTWVRPWGWTWVDDAAWGFAPFHYGRWISWRNRWCWVPGSYQARPVYAPALVAWLDGPSAGIGLRVGGPTLSWVPLAPWELFRPHYRSSPSYHDRVNTPDHRRWQPPPRRSGDHRYGNEGVPGAVTVVPSDRLRPRPIDRDRDRDRAPDREHDRDRDRDPRRPADEVRVAPPPAPTAPLVPMPTRPQPVQPAPVRPVPAQPAPVAPLQPLPTRPQPAPHLPVQPRPVQPAPVTPIQPPPTRPQPMQPTPAQPAPVTPVQPPARPQPTQPAQPVQPMPVQPPPARTPPRAPPPVETRPAPAEPKPAVREREKEPPSEEGRGKSKEGRGQQR